MNIHPLFVHFPIGILVLYSAFEFARVKLLTKQNYYVPLKALLVIIGTSAAYLTMSTGEMAEHIVLAEDPSKRALIEMHSLFAGITTTVYTFIALYYLVSWLRKAPVIKELYKRLPMQKLLKLLSPLVVPAAAFGLVAITITGGLGASIVYGPDVDPIVSFIYRLFF